MPDTLPRLHTALRALAIVAAAIAGLIVAGAAVSLWPDGATRSAATRTSDVTPSESPLASPSVESGTFDGTYYREDLGCHLIIIRPGEAYELILPDGVRLDEYNGTWLIRERGSGGKVIANEGDRLVVNGVVTDSGGSFCGHTAFLQVTEFLPG
jgi:hypothetical protein